MAKFDRSKFKTSNSLAQQEKELSSKIKQNNYSNGLPGWIELKEDGEYLLRFWPTPVENSYFMLPSMVHYLEMELDKYQDGEILLDSSGNPVKEVRKGTVFNSRIHGNTPKDIIEEYIAFVNKLADDTYPNDVEGKKKYLRHITGYGSGKDYVGGIDGVLDYVAYASLMIKNAQGEYVEKEFGRVRLRPSIRKQMLKLSSTEDGEDGLETDPFTDPDDGFIVKIVRDSVEGKKDPANYYQVSWCSKNYVPVKSPLPEGFEEKYDELPTLSELYENRYNAKSFSMAIDGLQRFDKTHGYGVFSYDEFMDICEEISQYYPDEEDEVQEREEKKSAPTKVEEPKQSTPKVEETKQENSSSPVSTEGLSPKEKLQQMKERLKG